MRKLVVVVAVAACQHSYTAGDSMIPTIAIGEAVALSKPEPIRGRIVVFRYPEKQYIKRIIGVAGDTIAADGPAIAVNGTPIPRCRVGRWGYGTHHGELWLEALDGATWLVFNGAERTAPVGSWTIAPGHVFVVADNRDNATDSRNFGGLPIKQIVGTTTRAPILPPGAESLAAAFAACRRVLGTVPITGGSSGGA
jgi:signal peptidase I